MVYRTRAWIEWKGKESDIYARIKLETVPKPRRTKGGGEKFSYLQYPPAALEGVAILITNQIIVMLLDEVARESTRNRVTRSSGPKLSNYKADYILCTKGKYLVKFSFLSGISRGDLTKDRHMGKHTEPHDAFHWLSVMPFTSWVLLPSNLFTKRNTKRLANSLSIWWKPFDFGIMFHTFLLIRKSKMPLIASLYTYTMVNGYYI